MLSYRNSLILLAMLCASSVCYGEFTPIVGWDSQVFPSHLVATSTMKGETQKDPHVLGDAYGIFGISVTAPADKTSIHVTVQCDGYAESSEYVGVLPTKGQTYRVFPKMRYRYDRLSQCNQATPTSVVFKVQLGTEIIEESICTITMRSINDCPFALVEGDNVVADLSHVFAAYVNEQHPFVDKLLREALDQGMVDSFTGYQSKDKNQVLAQVYALWDLMVTRDVRYSSITATAAESQCTRSQHVRLLEQTVNNTQANCVDGSVLFASMLRKIGIDSALVMTEDHCYVAFWADENHESMYAIETTLISSQEELEETPAELEDVVAEDVRWEVSWASFVPALVETTASLKESLKRKEPDVTLIDVGAARLAGVLPIPFIGNEQFVALEIDYDDSESEDETSEEVADDASEDADEEDSRPVKSASNKSSQSNGNSQRKSSSSEGGLQWD